MADTLTPTGASDEQVAVATAASAQAVAPAPRPDAEIAARGRRLPARIAGLDYRWLALAVVLGGSIMTILDATVVNVAIKTLQDAFDARSYSDIAWVVTGYTLAQGAVIPVTGWATDRFGTKRLYLITLMLFTVASAACGAAWSLPALIVFRVLQGLGGGMLMPIGMTIILRAFGPQQMGRVMGYFGVPMLIAPAVGPVLGGWFVQDFSWRLIFYINVPVGAVSLAAAWFLLRETPTSRSFRLDVLGLLTATPAVVALMYALDRSNELGWSSPVVVSLLAAATVLGVAFVVRQRATDHPLLHLGLFRDTTFSLSIVVGFIVITAMFGAVFLLPVFLQQVHGYGALDTGLLLLPQALTAMVLMPFGGALTDRIGPRLVVTTGLVFLVIGTLVLAQLHADTGIPVICAAMAFRGVAMAFAMMPAMSAGLARVPRELTSRASSITNTCQRVGTSLGIAMLVAFLGAQTSTAASQASCDPSPQARSEAAAVLHLPATPSASTLCALLQSRAASSASAASSAPAPVSTGRPAYDAFVRSYRDSASSIAFDRTFVFLAAIAAAGILPALFLRRPERRAQAAPPEAVAAAH